MGLGSPTSIIGGIGGLASGLLGEPPTTTNTSGNTTGTSETNSNQSSQSQFTQFLNSLLNSLSSTSGGTTNTSSTTPNLSPATQQLLDQLTGKYLQSTNPSLQGYQAQQTQGINRNSNLQSQAVDNIMASRGLSTSPVAGTAQANVQNSRIGQITGLNESLPLLQDQLNQSHLASAANFMNMIPHGTTTTGGTTNTQDTTGQQSTSQTSGGQQFNNQWGYQGNNYNQNSNQTSTTQQKGGLATGITGLLAGLFSDARLKKDIKPAEKAVDKLMKLHPVTWKWKGGDSEDSGFLAQDLLKSMPELVDKNDESGFLKVNYAGLISTLVGAVQELNAEVQS